jgi:hypothetical protein
LLGDEAFVTTMAGAVHVEESHDVTDAERLPVDVLDG